jgi:hypothetical protein
MSYLALKGGHNQWIRSAREALNSGEHEPIQKYKYTCRGLGL